MDISEHFRVIWRHKWRILAVAVAIALVVYLRSSTLPEVYEAQTLLQATSGRAAAGESFTRDDTQFLGQTYAELATTRPVIAAAVQRSGLSLTVPDALDLVTAARSGDAGFIVVAAHGSTPNEAERLSQAVANEVKDVVAQQQRERLKDTLRDPQAEADQLNAQLQSAGLTDSQRTQLESRRDPLVATITGARLRPRDRVELVAPARAPRTPVAPTPTRDAILALLAALVINAELSVLLEAMSGRFSTDTAGEDITRITGLPILAEIPRGSGEDVIEAFRTLRTSLMFLSTTERLRSLSVASVDPNAGKTFVALNLARETAALDVAVALVDGDLRRPQVHDRLNLPLAPGLTEALMGGRVPDETLNNVEGMRVLTAGSPVPDPAGLLGGQPFQEVLDTMVWAALVVVDTPAGNLFADAAAIASQCDATMIVVDVRATRRRDVRDLVNRLRQVNAQPIGVVLNRTESTGRAAYYAQRDKGRLGRSRSSAAST
ncbi:MAG: polysaccharide biosynthesis tyrosine autokinase [Acidimicrobiales bacterium]